MRNARGPWEYTLARARARARMVRLVPAERVCRNVFARVCVCHVIAECILSIIGSRYDPSCAGEKLSAADAADSRQAPHSAICPKFSLGMRNGLVYIDSFSLS